MFKVLLLLAAISAAQTCSTQFEALPNDNDILNLLSGTFLVVATTSVNTVDCEKSTWSGSVSDSSLKCYIETPVCCNKAYDPIVYPGEVDLTVSSQNSNTGCLPSTTTVRTKYLMSVGSGNNLCIVAAACSSQREGTYIHCRQTAISQSSLTILINFVYAILTLFSPSFPSFLPVNQTNCTIPENNCNP